MRKGFLSRQKRSIAVVRRDLERGCRARGLPAPARNTVAARIARIDPRQIARSREGPDAARRLQSAGGVPPAAGALMERVQVDHTVIEVAIRRAQQVPARTLTMADYTGPSHNKDAAGTALVSASNQDTKGARRA